nr:hypothetical protein [Leptolyngbya sp. 7M]
MDHVIAACDQITGMKNQARVSGLQQCAPPPQRTDIEDLVLRIAKIEDAERCVVSTCRPELMPLRKACGTAHSVGVSCIGSQAGETHRMVPRRPIFANRGAVAANHLAGSKMKIGCRNQFRDLRDGILRGHVGAPCHGHSGRRVFAGGENDLRLTASLVSRL